MTQIHAAILSAMKDIALTGIAKLNRNTAQNYNFRGIEAAMNELSPILIRNGIIVTSEYNDIVVTERFKGDPKDGKAMRFCTLRGGFRFMAADGSQVTSECYGEAMDSGDKAVVKAQSVAFRTALFQQFVVPTMALDPEQFEEDAPPIPDALLDAARTAALGGWKSFALWIKARTPEERKALNPESDALKRAAKEADAREAA